VSVILDALRRRRRESSATESSSRGVPAGLGLASAVSTVSRQRGQRVTLIVLAALIVLVGVWIDLRLNSDAVVTESTPVQSLEAPVAPQPTPAPAAPAPQAPQANLAANPAAEPRITTPELRIPNPESRPPNPEPRTDHFALALRYQNLGDLERAREHYLAVLAANEFNVEARNNLALLYHGRGMTSDAIDQFHRAIQINPRYTKARNNLAVVLTGAGRLAEARAELRAALDVEPRSADLLVNMALVEKADQHAEQAVELLIQALTTSPSHAAAHYNLAVLYEERDSLALAVDHYNAFLKYAGPEHGTLLSDVQRRVRAIEPRLQHATN
jgi:Tfp pilus assembly protein PilF